MTVTIERLEQEVDAMGAAYVILTLDLGAFVEPADRDTLLHLRGRREFNEFLQRFDPGDARFERDENYKLIEQRGYELGVFNRVLAEENFTPTYRLVKAHVRFPPELENNVQFKDKFLKIWKRWDFWFRLSGNGVVTIILKLEINQSRQLILISRDVMGLQGHFDMDSARRKLAELEAGNKNGANRERIASIQQFMDWVRRHAMVDIEREFPAVVWQMAVEVMHQFVEACRGQLSYKNDSLSFTLNLRTEPEHNGVGSLREKYTIFYFNEMGHYNWDVKERTLLNPEQMVHEQYRRLIPGLLEGVIIRGKSSYYYPSHTCGYIEEMVAANMSSWQNELCILTDQSALIYPHMPRQGHQVVFPSQHLAYAKYWECILRALEFGVESRLLVQLAKQMTSAYLADALLFLRKDSIVAQQDLRSFDFKAANAARLLSHLRTITAPHIIAQANYSVNKLQMFLQQTGVPQVLSHAETNLNDLSNLVERSHELSLQRESQRSNELALGLSVIFGGLTFGLAILALPSFIVDWEAENSGFLSRRWYYSFLPYLGEVLVLCLAFLGLVMFVLAFISLIHRLSRRRTERV